MSGAGPRARRKDPAGGDPPNIDGTNEEAVEQEALELNCLLVCAIYVGSPLTQGPCAELWALHYCRREGRRSSAGATLTATTPRGAGNSFPGRAGPGQGLHWITPPVHKTHALFESTRALRCNPALPLWESAAALLRGLVLGRGRTYVERTGFGSPGWSRVPRPRLTSTDAAPRRRPATPSKPRDLRTHLSVATPSAPRSRRGRQWGRRSLASCE